MKVIVIGGGPAGMMAAITAAKAGNQVTLLEKNKYNFRKIYCNNKGLYDIIKSINYSEVLSWLSRCVFCTIPSKQR